MTALNTLSIDSIEDSLIFRVCCYRKHIIFLIGFLNYPPDIGPCLIVNFDCLSWSASKISKRLARLSSRYHFVGAMELAPCLFKQHDPKFWANSSAEYGLTIYSREPIVNNDVSPLSIFADIYSVDTCG